MGQGNPYIDQTIKLGPTGKGSLDGLTFAVKDVFDIAGHAASAGNPDWLKTHKPAESTASAIAKLLSNGAAMQGVTITDELMYSINGENAHYGTPANPAAPGRIPGGSSSGSASAVASGLADFALGTDTGGSVRVPSALCGLYGIRPTHGVVDVTGLIPLAPSFDTIGWMARDMATLRKVGKALLREEDVRWHEAINTMDVRRHEAFNTMDVRRHEAINTMDVRRHEAINTTDVRRHDAFNTMDVGKPETFKTMLLGADLWGLCDRETQQALRAFLDNWRIGTKMAGEREEIILAEEGLPAWVEVFRHIQAIEIWEQHGEWISQTNPSFGPGIAERFKWASTLSREQCSEAFVKQKEIAARMDHLLADDTVLVVPTVPGVAPLCGLGGEAVEQNRARTLQMSCPAGLAGLPQVTVPVASGRNGLPVGLSFIAGRGQDHRLLDWLAATKV
ncbi:amidase family protein [Paenibacillus sp. CAU 1782]